MKNAGLTKAIEVAGSMRKLAHMLDLHHHAVQQWVRARVPADRIVEIERITGVPREELRPDLYRRKL